MFIIEALQISGNIAENFNATADIRSIMREEFITPKKSLRATANISNMSYAKVLRENAPMHRMHQRQKRWSVASILQQHLL